MVTVPDGNSESWDELIGGLEGKTETDIQIALLSDQGSRDIPLEMNEGVKTQMKGRAFKGTDDRIPMYGPKTRGQGWVQSLIPKSQVMFRMKEGFTLRPTQDAPQNTEPCNTMSDDGSMCKKMFRNILHRMAHIKRYHQMASEVIISQEDVDRLSGKLPVPSSNARLADLEAKLAEALEKIETLTSSRIEDPPSTKKKVDQ